MRSLLLIGIHLLLLLYSGNSFGTHLRAGEIQVRRINCNSLTFQITLVIYVNTIGTSVQVGGQDDFMSFGDGASILIGETQTTMIDPLGIGKTVVTIEHTYQKPGHYLISYSEPSRNVGVVNMDLSVITRFHIETMIVVEEGKCNNYPILLTPPIDRACHKTTFFHNPGGFDADGDSLSYELALPKKDDANPVANYRNPNHPSFYTSFNQANEAGTGPPIFQIDPITGLLTWDTPGATGEYAVALKIREWKKDVNGSWYESSYIIRDMQILVNECANRKSALNFQDEVCVVAGEPVEIRMLATDPDGDSVRVDFFSELFEVAVYKPEIKPPSIVGRFNPSPLELIFTMETSCAWVRNKPYILNIKLTDRNKEGSSLTRFYTIKISIIAPPPKIESVVVNPVTRQVSLQWSIPSCENVQTFQIWRRTSSITYEESKCAKGMPSFLRYDLIAVVPQSQSTFTDHNLEIGSQYCYRIIAVIVGNNPGKLSLDTCLIPKPAEAPVITNVSVEETSVSEGKISVKWTKPFEIDKIQYPAPYQYQVFRKNETLATPFEKVGGLQSDTTFTDQHLNTSQYAYRYFVELYVVALSALPVDSSSRASSIIAVSESKVEQIDLHWSAQTPWTNYAAKYPYHLIFRSTKSDGPFELIDSINVLSNDFMYSDRGRYRSIGLTRDLYYYKIMTRGTYGNPAIAEPLQNLSPIISGQLLDTVPPCSPGNVRLVSIACNQFSCDGKSYYTSLHWDTLDQTCDEDVVAYEVLTKSDTAQVYTSLAIVNVPMYHHNNLTNLDYCYRVVSIDHAGNRSDSSASVCNSSCLNFKLPNVITPGSIDAQNDYLATYDGDNSSEDHCARSVRRVELLVYNRWGEEIFLKTINNNETNILWPGTTSSGIDVSAGVYFVNAQVEFQTNDPSKRRQEVKGWVHVLR